MDCCKGQAYDRMFNAKKAAKELRAYERRGPRGATRRLLDALGAHPALGSEGGFTHLDIGGGVGVLQHELVAAGATRTTAVDASAPYLALLRGAAEARGYADQQLRVEGDFVGVADQVQPASVVTLDKVICCYPDMPRLVAASASKATQLYGIVVPKDAGHTRLGLKVLNLVLRTVLRWDFQAFLHAHGAIDQACRDQGLGLLSAQDGLVWSVRVYQRA